MVKKSNIKTRAVARSTSSRNTGRSNSNNKSQKMQIKSLPIGRRTASPVQNRMITRRSGDSGNATLRGDSTLNKINKVFNLTPSKSILAKSPQIKKAETKQNLNTQSERGQKNLKTRKGLRMKRDLPGRQIQIVIDTPKSRSVKSNTKDISRSPSRSASKKLPSIVPTPTVKSVKGTSINKIIVNAPTSKKAKDINVGTPSLSVSLRSQSKSQTESSAPTKQITRKNENLQKENLPKKVQISNILPKKILRSQKSRARIISKKVPTQRMATRGRDESINKKIIEEAMRSVDKVRLTPKKQESVPKSHPSKSSSNKKEIAKNRKKLKVKRKPVRKEIQIVIETPKPSQSRNSSHIKSQSKVLRSASKSKPQTPSAKPEVQAKDFNITIETPAFKKVKQQEEQASSAIRSSSRSSPKKSQAQSRGQSKAKERMRMMVESEEKDKNFLKKALASISPSVKKKSEIIKPKKKEEPKKSPVLKSFTRQGRSNVINKKRIDETIKSIDKLKTSPKKTSVSNKSPSATPSKIRERSRNEEDKSLRAGLRTNVALANFNRKTKSNKQAPIRTPTKNFEKEKTPSSSSEEKREQLEEEEEKEVESTEENKNKKKKFASKSNIQVKKATKAQIKDESVDSEEVSEKIIEDDKKVAASSLKTKIVKRPIKHQVSYDTDIKGISAEISKILKRIEERKKKPEKKEPREKVKAPKKRAVLAKKLTAVDYGFQLQRNPNIKTEHIVKISDLVAKPIKTHTDILLAILEIASNADYYQISFLNNSRFFWEDIIKYNELANIFSGFKGETLRKYWRYLSTIGDVNKIADMVKRHKKFLDETNIKLLSIICAIRAYFSGKITDFEAGIKGMTFTSKSKEIFEEEEVNDETGDQTKIKTIKIKTKRRNKYLQIQSLKFEGVNYLGSVDEVFGKYYQFFKFRSHDEKGGYLEYVRRVLEEEKKKFLFLKNINDEDKKKILSLNEEDKFLFNVFDSIIDGLHAEFPDLDRNIIAQVLDACSMNIEYAFKYLSDNENNQKLLFNPVNDSVILTKKDFPEYNSLVREKGGDRVQEREDYLLG